MLTVSNSLRSEKSAFCIVWSNVPLLEIRIIRDYDMISMLWGNMTYCVTLSSEDLSHYLNEIESVCLQKMFKESGITITNVSQSSPQIMAD